MNYDFDSLYLETMAASFSSGKRRFYDNKVSNLLGAEKENKFCITGKVAGKKEYSPAVTFDEGGAIYDYTCNCSVFSPQDGPCKHIIALALAYEDKFPQKQIVKPAGIRERSDAAALTLSAEYSKRRHTRYLASDEEKVKLVPVLQLKDGERFALRFMIGRNKMYTLKDVSDFVSAVQSVGYRRYGVELELEHNIENFNEKSQEVIRFLIASYLEKAELFKDFQSLSNAYRDELLLIANDADEFIKMFEGQLVQFDDKSVKDGVRLIVNNNNLSDVKIDIEKVNGGYVFTSTLADFNIVNGKNFGYFITDSKIYKVSKEFVTTLAPLLKALNTLKKLYVAEADMPYFYNSVVTAAEQFMTVETGGNDLTVYEASPFVAKIYLSNVGDGSVKAAVSCTYDDESINIFDDNYIAPYVRDWDAEASLKKILVKYFPSFPDMVIDRENDIYNLMAVGISELFNYAEIFLEENVKKMKVKKPPRIRVGVRIESDLLKVDLDAEDYTVEQLREILSSYREKKNYVRLRDGSFVDLKDSSIGALSEMLEGADAQKFDFALPKYYAPYLNNLLSEGFFSLDRDAGFKQLIKNLASARDLDIPVPEDLKDIMRNYQKTGFRWMKALSSYGFGGILADDMGLGKSLQVIALLKSERKGTSIIVCPTTLTLNWVNEFEKFAPDIKILAVTGNFDERKNKAIFASDYDVVITSYELLRRDIELYKDMEFNFGIIDEAQYIKNPETKNARAVKKLNAKHKFALTGTPVENSLAELWSIFDFIMPGYLYSYSKFRDKFEADVVHGDSEAAYKLKKLVSPFIIRRLKSAVLTELPPKVETNVESALEDEQEKLYKANLSIIKESVKSAGTSVNKVVVLSMLTKLRQICCEPRLAYPDYTGNSAKLDTCMEIVTQAVSSGHKVLLFSQFTSMLDIIRTKLIENGISYYMLKGDTPKAERMRLVNRFNTNDTNVFLISLKAGGTGLNLTGADVVVHYDPWWNESVMNQATDRAYRIGQDKSVQVYKLILKDTIEEKILKLQEKKTALSSLVVGKEQSGESALSYEDIMLILK